VTPSSVHEGLPEGAQPGRLILASASPRRRELLRRIGLHVAVVPPADVERPPREGDSPEEYVTAAALAKAQQVAEAHPEDLVLGADTVVVVDGRVLGKPAGATAQARAADAARMLRLLSGREHQVHTGLALVRGNRSLATDVVTTQVRFRPLAAWEIAAYVATGEPLDKAGAYGIQGRAAVFVEQVRGCYFNVVGLPLARLWELLLGSGCRPWAGDGESILPEP